MPIIVANTHYSRTLPEGQLISPRGKESSKLKLSKENYRKRNFEDSRSKPATEKLPNRKEGKQSRVAVEKNANVNFETKGNINEKSKRYHDF